MKGWEICQNKMKKQENWYSYVNGKCDFSAVRITGAVERYSSMIIGSTCQEDHQFSLYVYHNLGLNYIKQKLTLICIYITLTEAQRLYKKKFLKG